MTVRHVMGEAGGERGQESQSIGPVEQSIDGERNSRMQFLMDDGASYPCSG